MATHLTPTELLSIPKVATLLDVPEATLKTKPWRLRHGLAAVKLGRSIRFRRADVERLIQRSLERIPGQQVVR
jgi:predicted DNA-binding transcriptional regulator AlpA